MVITVIDYGASNLRSVEKAFKYLGYDVNVTGDHRLISDADKLVLPGNGAFSDCMSNLSRLGIGDAISAFISKERSFLGICIGMQVLADIGHEFGDRAGFGIISGDVKRFELSKDYKIPHTGWNMVNITTSSDLFKEIEDNSYFYFVHSYYFDVKNRLDTIAVTDYCIKFSSAVEHNNIFGVQFHPEKSQSVGLKLLDNFCKI